MTDIREINKKIEAVAEEISALDFQEHNNENQRLTEMFWLLQKAVTIGRDYKVAENNKKSLAKSKK